MIKRQNQLCSIGIIKTICEVVSDPNIKDDIIFEAVILCIALLLGGNKKAQESIYENLSNDESNRFLVALKRIILENFQTVQVSMIS